MDAGLPPTGTTRQGTGRPWMLAGQASAKQQDQEVVGELALELVPLLQDRARRGAVAEELHGLLRFLRAIAKKWTRLEKQTRFLCQRVRSAAACERCEDEFVRLRSGSDLAW